MQSLSPRPVLRTPEYMYGPQSGGCQTLTDRWRCGVCFRLSLRGVVALVHWVPTFRRLGLLSSFDKALRTSRSELYPDA